MILAEPLKYQKRFRRPRRRGNAPPANLTLVAANYVASTSLTLVFDRAIDIDAINGSQIVVNDAAFAHQMFDGTGAPPTLVNPTTVRLTLLRTMIATGSLTVLNATEDTGIVAANDGGTWDGATELALPYP